MAKDPKIGVFWKLLFCSVTCLAFALPVLSDRTSCSDWYDLNYTLPMFQKCKMMRLHDGSMVQSIPKLIPFPSVTGGYHQRKSKEGIPGGHRICKIPYCDENLCNNGWCEETMVGYNCTCSSGFQGRHCDEMIIESTTELTTKPTTTTSERSNTTTSQNTTTSKSTKEATTKPTTSPSTTMTERSDTTTSQGTTTSEWVQTRAKTKSATSPTTTMPGRSDATTSQETTTSTCSSPPVEDKYGESVYNFSTCMMNHASAVSACSQYGSHLVFIDSQQEEDFIVRSVQYLSDRNTNYYWIGLTGLSLSEARWLDGSSLTYSNFNLYSFNDNVSCFMIKCRDRYSRWHDHDCSTQLRFICEKEVGI